MVPEESSNSPAGSDIAVPLVTEADAPSRDDELLEAPEQTEDRFAELIKAHAVREEELRSQLGSELNQRLEAEINRAFGALLGMLEDSLSQVLMPFLTVEVRIRAVSDLMKLIRQELREADGPVLEIRAPAAVHDALATLQDQSAVSITIAESATVEIILASQRARFEELSSRWCAAIEGGER